MQNKFSAFRFPFSVVVLFHPDSNRRYRNFTDSIPHSQQLINLRHTGVADYHRR